MPTDPDDDVVRELRRRARKRLAVPAGLLLLMAVFGSVFAVVVLYMFVSSGPTESGLGSVPFAWAIPAFGLLWCLFIGYGAWELDRMGNLRVARAASIVAAIPVPIPAYLLWLVGAVMSLTALRDPAVRAAFKSGNRPERDSYLDDYRDRIRAYLARRARDAD